jgi:hypothetical protein
MILAICGLTVVGTGTERAGTSSIWAWAGNEPAIPIAAHNSVVMRSFDATTVRIPAAGFLIAFPLIFLFVLTHRDDLCALDAPPATPLDFNYSRTQTRGGFPDRTALQQDAHSILIFAS